MLTVIKKFPQWATLVCSARLSAIHRIECLVQEKAKSPRRINPGRTVFIKSRVVPKEGQKVHNHKAETSEGDLSICQVEVELSG